MEITLMIFSALCVTLYSGGSDCSYQWVQVSDDVLMEQWEAAGGKVPYPASQQLAGFMDPNDKKVWFGSPALYHVIAHEIKHVICQLELDKSGVNHPKCKGHFGLTY
jgi:hypothetical protein